MGEGKNKGRISTERAERRAQYSRRVYEQGVDSENVKWGKSWEPGITRDWQGLAGISSFGTSLRIAKLSL
jgi:hypothetical protein